MSKLQAIIGDALDFWFPDYGIIPNARPDWLYGLELDFYIPSFGLAIEVQGRQHYFFCPEFHRSVDDFQAQRQRDQSKLRTCNASGIRLLTADERTSCMLGGLCTKLTQHFNRKFFAPKSIAQEWEQHRRLLAHHQRETYIAFKVRGSGELTPLNKVSSRWLKSQSKSPFKTKLREAAHVSLSSSQETVVTPAFSPPSSRAKTAALVSGALHPGGAAAVTL